MPIKDLSHKSDSPPQECEVRVEIKDGEDWVRLPVTLCELWVNKDGPANISRNAKVKFPGEWGGHSILQYLNGFSPGDEDADDPSIAGDAPGEPGAASPTVEFDQARIWFLDHDTGNYQIAHYGFVGAIGPAAEDGVYKLWVYDPADLMRRIRVSKSFGQPTIQQVLNFVLRGTDDNGREVGIERRSSFDNIKTYIAGIQEVRQQKFVEEQQEEEIFDSIGGSFNFVLDSSLPIVGPFQLAVDDLVADVFDWAKDNLIDPTLTGQKRFQLNRHNMVDLMDWFAADIGGKWHFEPTPTGPVLFFDNSRSRGVEATIFGARQRGDGELTRRQFIDHELIEEGVTLDDITAGEGSINALGDVSDYADRGAFDLVTTLDNDALMDIKPFNALTLYGETHDPAEYSATGAGPPTSGVVTTDDRPPAAPIRSSRFPRVQVRYPPLIRRAGGYEYEAPAVESDKISLDQAKQEAIKEFRSYLEESTEGSIELLGNPYIAPYDLVTTIPACNGIYPNTEAPPMTYEVNGVKHRRGADEHYTTELDVSFVMDETKLEVEAEYRDA